MKIKKIINYKFDYATIYQRAIAQIIDSLLFIILFFVLFSKINIIILLLIEYFLYLIYFIFFEFNYGQTPGKKMINIKVVDNNGEPPTFNQILFRNLFRIIDFLPFFYISGAISILINDEKKRIGDIFSKTVVISTQKVLDSETERKILKSIRVVPYSTEKIERK